MPAEITTIRTAAQTAAALESATPTDLAGLDARTLTAVTGVLRAAAELARAQRPIILHAPEAAPAVAPGTAAYGAHVRIPPSPTDAAAITPQGTAALPRRHTLWGDKVVLFGCGAMLSGVVGALVATYAGPVWVLVISAIGAVMCPIGAASVNRAERAAQGRL
jgi:hypothetical protein